MHEFKRGELKSGRGGKGGKVKSRKQAIAIALREAGQSKYDSASENRRSRAKARQKEARGETARQEREGKSRIAARGRRESTRAQGGENARELTSFGKRAARSRGAKGPSKAQLHKKAKRKRVTNRSKMTKTLLENALR